MHLPIAVTWAQSPHALLSSPNKWAYDCNIAWGFWEDAGHGLIITSSWGQWTQNGASVAQLGSGLKERVALGLAAQGSVQPSRRGWALWGAAHQLQPHVPSLQCLQKMFSD